MNLEQLNESQRQAVCCTDAPMLVIAGAGSGKTRVLTYKIAYLLTQGYAPQEILALTFTNKAAREMQTRIADEVGAARAARLWMGTFHSIFCRILRYEAPAIGFRSDFSIYDAADSKALVATIIKEMGLDDKQYKPLQICSRISKAKNGLLLPSAYAADPRLRREDELSRTPLVHEIYANYSKRCRQSNAMDFDDILLYTWLLLSEHPDVTARYAERFRYVLVDEYQDTNYAQHRIVWLLAREHRQVCVVGDDAQSIYSFRGANIDNILQFQQQYAGAKLFKLEQNYRSTQTIVSAANSLIRHNRNQIHKDVFSKNEVGAPIEVYPSYSDADEASIMVRRLRRFVREEEIPLSRMAVLYRTNAQSRSLEEALRREAVPYRIYGGLSFYQRKEVKDVIAYFRLAVNPDDEVSLKRVINYPARAIGQTTLDKLFQCALESGLTPWQVLASPEMLPVNRGTQGRLEAFHQLILSFAADVNSTDAYTLGMRILQESGLRKTFFSSQAPEDLSRQENVQELLDGMSLFVQEAQEQGTDTGLATYLQEVSLLSDMDESEGDDGDRVTLMSIHASKGLEFDAVVVTGMEENIFPGQMALDSPRQMEEERRLCYVAMTRARRHLVLTYARSRFRYGKTEFGTPSRFLGEIDQRYLRAQEKGGAQTVFSKSGDTPFTSFHGRHAQDFQPTSSESVRSHTPQPASASRFVRLSRASSVAPSSSASRPVSASSAPTIQPGARIAHERFGQGTVLSVEGSGLDTKARVSFDNVGEKQLLLRFAKFRLLD